MLTDPLDSSEYQGGCKSRLSSVQNHSWLMFIVYRCLHCPIRRGLSQPILGKSINQPGSRDDRGILNTAHSVTAYQQVIHCRTHDRQESLTAPDASPCTSGAETFWGVWHKSHSVSPVTNHNMFGPSFFQSLADRRVTPGKWGPTCAKKTKPSQTYIFFSDVSECCFTKKIAQHLQLPHSSHYLSW